MSDEGRYNVIKLVLARGIPVVSSGQMGDDCRAEYLTRIFQ